MDARVSFEAECGSPVNIAFASENQLKTWPKLVPPNVPEAAQLIANLRTPKIGAHFTLGQ
jgi:hypothetical protein